MRKGTKVIYNGLLYVVWEKHGTHAKIYRPDAKFTELTMCSIPIKSLKKA